MIPAKRLAVIGAVAELDGYASVSATELLELVTAYEAARDYAEAFREISGTRTAGPERKRLLALFPEPTK